MKRCLPLFLSLIVLAVPAGASATTFGAEVGSDFTSQARGAWTQAKAISNLQGLYKAGGRVGRADSSWGLIEPKAPVKGVHTYVWNYDDMIETDMATAHLRWEPTLAFAPRWAEGNHSNVIHTAQGKAIAYLPPAKNSDFTAYATAFMRRYGPHGTFWSTYPKLKYIPVTTVEVWNEPDNLYDWGQHPNLQIYERMYEAVRTAIRRVSPSTKVLTGGLAWTPTSLPRLLKAFRGKPMDAIAIHPYGATPKATVKLASDALKTLKRYGRGKVPVSANEFGWTSIQHTWGSTKPKNVNNYVYQALIGLAKLRLSEIAPFSWSIPQWGLSTGSYAKALKKIQHR